MISEELHNQICSSVESLRDELLQITSDLVRIPSVEPNFNLEPEQSIGGESKVAAYMEKVMQEMGLKTDLWEEEAGRANVVGIYNGTGGGKSLLFNGHMDTVPGGNHEKWVDNNPWSGKIGDDRIWGRGSTDMKGGNAAAVIALKALLKAGLKPKGDVLLVNVVGEENMCTSAGTGAALKRGYSADAAIVCEPTSLNKKLTICPASPGVLVMVCNVIGKPTHSCMRDELVHAGGRGAEVGVSAIDKGFIVYQGLQELERQWGQTKTHPAFTRPGHFTISVSMVQGGKTGSIIPEDMMFEVGFFYPPQESIDDIKKEVEGFINNYVSFDPWLRENPPQYLWVFSWPGYQIPNDSPICKTMSSVAKSIDENYGDIYGFASVNDAAFINAHGIPCVAMGPGNLAQAHSDNEFVLIEELVAAAKIYALTIASWCEL